MSEIPYNQVQKGGKWKEIFARGKRNPVFTRVLHEKERFQKIVIFQIFMDCHQKNGMIACAQKQTRLQSDHDVTSKETI
jgi:hypothetical protein